MFREIVVKIFFLSCFLNIVNVTNSYACSCVRRPKDFKHCAKVFDGKAIKLNGDKVIFKVDSVQKGKVANNAFVNPSFGTPCPMEFAIGKKYRICVDKDFVTDLCQGNTQLPIF